MADGAKDQAPEKKYGFFSPKVAETGENYIYESLRGGTVVVTPISSDPALPTSPKDIESRGEVGRLVMKFSSTKRTRTTVIRSVSGVNKVPGREISFRLG